ncbi:MAG: PIN domain nuclease [Verrucomicrobia bacterium]|jgi:predicted nucleic acid-binding protein|nr:PIN domain nuclease [Verrucomicrobiota bacterium]
MLFVDTSVWIDFLADREGKQVNLLVAALKDEEPICYAGLVIQELFQGIDSPKFRLQIEKGFEPLIEIFPNQKNYRSAATLYRDFRSNGHQIRSSIDCLIAACCIEHKLDLLHHDRDFEYIAEISKLKLR